MMNVGGELRPHGNDAGGSEGFIARLAMENDTAIAVREQTERLLMDPLFHNSRRYTDLLRYIVEQTLAGEYDCLKERIIGIEVFNRAPDYDTSIDPTVRVAATEVRKRLALYYAVPSHRRELLIDVPVRSYVATFRPAEEPVVQPAVEPSVAADEMVLPVPRKWLNRRAYAALGTVLLVVLTSWILIRQLSPTAPIDKFWAPMVTGPNPVLICIGSTMSTMSPSGPTEGPSTDSNKEGSHYYDLSPLRMNVTMPDVEVATDLTAFLHRKGKESVIRPANTTKLSDLSLTQTILIGSYKNDWVMKLDDRLRFRFQMDTELGRRWIEDTTNPSNRSWGVDLSAPSDRVDQDYALITRVLDTTTGRWRVGIAGVSPLGTMTAYQVTTDTEVLNSLVGQFPKNWDKKNLQIVLAVSLVKGSPGSPRIVALNSW